MGNNDIVFDFDLVMAALSGRTCHDHNDSLAGYVLSVRDLIITRLATEDRLDAAWIIATRVGTRLKQALSGLDVEYIELRIDAKTAKTRLQSDPNGRDIAIWERVIDKYFGRVEQVNFYKTPEWRRKRKEILKRDSNECQRCKSMGRYSKGRIVHHVKHLDARPDLGFEDSNLLTVCEECHNWLHPEKSITPQMARRQSITVERW